MTNPDPMQTGAYELGKRRGRNEKPVDHSIDLAVSERERLGKGTGTSERLRKVGREGMELVPALPDTDKRGNQMPAGQVQRVLAAPLDRLWKTGFVTQREYNAGDAYRADAYMAAIDPSALTIDWNRTGGGTSRRVPSMFASQHIADARIRMRNLEQKIPLRSAVSTLLYLALIKEQDFAEIGASMFGLRDRREASVAGRVGLRVALAALADHRGE
jgi:hypothetical protein